VPLPARAPGWSPRQRRCSAAIRPWPRRAELTGRRDAATAGLAFELAGRLQAELEALDWISREQKVTRAQPCDLDVHGWADGVLVSFEIRGGRLCGWGRRDCDAGAARPHLDQTPDEWAGFARRSAELAARLRLDGSG
jgi:excinuclease ABC subunit C